MKHALVPVAIICAALSFSCGESEIDEGVTVVDAETVLIIHHSSFPM